MNISNWARSGVILAGLFVWARLEGAVTMGTVQRTDLVQQVTVAGSILPERKTIITAPYPAYVKKVFVKVGDKVKAGDPIVSLVQSLGDSSPVYPLRAPFNGTVVQVLHLEGEWVESAKDTSSLVRIDDLSRLYVQTEVPEVHITKIRKDQKVAIRPSGAQTALHEGVIRDIALAAKEKKGGWEGFGDRVAFEVRMEVLGNPGELLPGMSTVVDIIIDKKEKVLALPHEYVEKKDGEYFVTTEKGEKRKVGVGLQNEDMFEVTEGLKENDRVKRIDFFSLGKG